MNLTKQKTATIVAIVAMVAAAVLLYPRGNARSDAEPAKGPTHQQQVWIYALEWCESRGVMAAVNPKDRDNTPSYYSWQWKPTTFLEFALKYGVVPKGTTLAQATELMKQYDLQHAVITAMVIDGRHIDWEQQFPDCVKHKVGRPPL